MRTTEFTTGESGRFDSDSGREAGRKSRGGGRPRRALADLMDQGGETAVLELLRIVRAGEDHSLYAFALKELAKTCLPRRKETEVSAQVDGAGTFLEIARGLREAA